MTMSGLYCPLLIVGSYLLGSVSSAILVTWLWTGKDIRTFGNRNAGTANVARSVGLLPAILVGVADFSKGAIPVFVAHLLGLTDTCALSGAVMAVIGHSYPLYFRFRGGKGLAASLGALLVFTPLETLLVLPVLGLVYLIITGSAVTGALVGLALLIGLNLWRGYPLVVVLAPLVLMVTMGLCVIPQAIYDWRQRANKGNVFAYWLAPKERPRGGRPVAVITDSLASLPPEIRDRENVHTVPLILILPDGTYRDGVDIDSRQYYQLLREEKLSPKTSAPSPGEFFALYQRLAKKHKAAIVITAPKELTQIWESATLATEMGTDHFKVQVIDSHVAGPAQGFVALEAARAAASYTKLEAILPAVHSVMENVGFVAVLDTLKFLAEGGRVAEASQWIKSALRIYPILSIVRGRIRLVGMARTKSKAIEQMVHWLKSTLKNEKVALAFCHTDAFEEAAALEERLTAMFHPTESFVTELTPVIGAHTGPGLVGVAWWTQPMSRSVDRQGAEVSE
jgi:acyl-phosphate glycerol 3-phosphate acyltransferase